MVRRVVALLSTLVADDTSPTIFIVASHQRSQKSSSSRPSIETGASFVDKPDTHARAVRRRLTIPYPVREEKKEKKNNKRSPLVFAVDEKKDMLSYFASVLVGGADEARANDEDARGSNDATAAEDAADDDRGTSHDADHTDAAAAAAAEEVDADASASGGKEKGDGGAEEGSSGAPAPADGAGDKGKEKKEKAEETKQAGKEEKEEDEEEETCGFCRFMKGGSCKKAFVEWEKCVDTVKEAQGDFVEKCQKQTEALRDCMMADPKYYGDMLPAEGEEGEGGEGGGEKKEDEKENEKENEEKEK